jgi:hypothetical protein
MICNLTRIVSYEFIFLVIVLSSVVSLYLLKLNKFFPFLKPWVVNNVNLIIKLAKESILELFILFLKWFSLIIYLLLQFVEFFWDNYQYILTINRLIISFLIFIKKAVSNITGPILVFRIKFKTIVSIILFILVISLFIHCRIIGLHFL